MLKEELVQMFLNTKMSFTHFYAQSHQKNQTSQI